jgi:hypothetical protein
MRYARDHPHASDTTDGIVGWWLPQVGFEYAPDMIGSVLEELVARGTLRRAPLPDGSLLYTVHAPDA